MNYYVIFQFHRYGNVAHVLVIIVILSYFALWFMFSDIFNCPFFSSFIFHLFKVDDIKDIWL